MANRCVCIHVTSGLDQLELVLLADDNAQIQQVTSIPFNLYDASTRRLTHPEELVDSIKQLFVSAKLPIGAQPTVLVLPSYFSKNLELSGALSADDTQMVLLGEVETHYMFKSQEPAIDWIPLDDQRVYYSVFIKEDIDYWLDACSELKISLIALDTGFFAALRGLMASGALRSVVEHTRPWMLLLVTDTTCQMGIFQGYTLKQAEELPLGTVDIQMAISDIKEDVYRLLEQQMVDQLIIINNTLRLDINTLKQALALDMPTIDIVQNKHTVASLGAQADGLYPCTIEGLGGVLTAQFPNLPQLNFAPKSNFNFMAADNAKRVCLQYLIVANVAAAVVCLVCWLGLQGLIWFKSQSLQEQSAEKPPMVTTGNGITPPTFRPGRVTAGGIGETVSAEQENEIYKRLLVKTLYDRNLWLNNLLVTVGGKLPASAWMKEFIVTELPVEAKTTVNISGSTDSAEVMNAFQQLLTKEFEQKSPTLVSIDADSNTPAQYNWVFGLNLNSLTASADPNAPKPPAGPPG